MANLVFNSSRFGEGLEVPEEAVIIIDILGFVQQRYVLIDEKEPFSWLHSIDDPNLAFIVFDGGSFLSNYDESALRFSDIDFRDNDECAMLILVTIHGSLNGATCNLKAPVFINLRNRKGCQLVFDASELSTRKPLIEVLPHLIELPKEDSEPGNVQQSDADSDNSDPQLNK